MVVFFDIDGTVIDDETQIIPDSTAEAVKLLRQNGHLSVVNTGRPHGHIDPKVRALGFDGWICACGMEVILDGQYVFRDVPTAEDCRWVFREAHRCGMMIQAESDTQLIYYSAELKVPRTKTAYRSEFNDICFPFAHIIKKANAIILRNRIKNKIGPRRRHCLR